MLTRSVDRYPHFLAPIGARGTVTEVKDWQIAATFDRELNGAGEWDNSILWDSDTDTLQDFEGDIVRTYLD
jgi:hypothetical protein